MTKTLQKSVLTILTLILVFLSGYIMPAFGETQSKTPIPPIPPGFMIPPGFVIDERVPIFSTSKITSVEAVVIGHVTPEYKDRVPLDVPLAKIMIWVEGYDRMMNKVIERSMVEYARTLTDTEIMGMEPTSAQTQERLSLANENPPLDERLDERVRSMFLDNQAVLFFVPNIEQNIKTFRFSDIRMRFFHWEDWENLFHRKTLMWKAEGEIKGDILTPLNTELFKAMGFKAIDELIRLGFLKKKKTPVKDFIKKLF